MAKNRQREPDAESLERPNKKSKFDLVQQLKALFVFNDEKTSKHLSCFRIAKTDVIIDSFSIWCPVSASDWGSSPTENLSISLDEKEEDRSIVLCIRDQNRMKIGHFEQFESGDKFMSLFYALNDDVSAEISITFIQSFLVARITIGLPLHTIDRMLQNIDVPSLQGLTEEQKKELDDDVQWYLDNYQTATEFLLQLIYGSKIGDLPKLLIDSKRALLSFPDRLQSPSLSSKLLNYQKDTVDWMLEREGVKLGEGLSSIEPVEIKPVQSLIELCQGLYFDTIDGTCTDNKNGGMFETYRGGILCDEMGMGKTLMALSTICLHKLKDPKTLADHAGDLLPIKANLIVTPQSILAQWIQETEKNTPNLSFYTYDGFKSRGTNGNPVDEEFLSKFDIVFTTYQTLQREIHAANSGREGARRGDRAVYRRNSPLVSVYWFRVVLDEAQMVESTVSNASAMACKIPRHISWSVTGTPCPKTGRIDDMKGLFVFANSTLADWSFTKKLPGDAIGQMLLPILHRDSIVNRPELLSIPKPVDQTFFITFTAVEEQWYADLLDNAIREIGHFPEMPGLEGKGLDEARVVIKQHEDVKSRRFLAMAKWFLRLRQTCCHPKASNEGKRILGGRARTMEEVLDTMVQRTKSSLHSSERSLVTNEIDKGQLLERQGEFEEAIKIYEGQLPVCISRIESLNNELMEIFKTRQLTDNMTEEPESITRLKLNIRHWNEVQHRLFFFIGGAHHSLGQEEKEEQNYDEASLLRAKMLREFENAYAAHKDQLAKAYPIHQKFFDSEFLIPLDMAGGIVTRKYFAELEPIEDQLNEQWDYLMEWRHRIKEILGSLALEDSDEKPTGEEYETGIKDQEVALVFQEMFRILILYRKELLTAEPKNHPNCDGCGEVILRGKVSDCAHMFCKTCATELKRPKSTCPLCHEKIVYSNLEDITSAIEIKKPPQLSTALQKELFKKIQNLDLDPKDDSYKAIAGKIKSVLTRHELPDHERDVARAAYTHMMKTLGIQQKFIARLENEVLLFRQLHNARIKYFRQVNKLSDTVVESTWNDPAETVLARLEKNTDELSKKIDLEMQRKRYISHIVNNQEEVERQCPGCLDDEVQSGFLTECGHFCCLSCTQKWVTIHNKCVGCNGIIDPNQLFRITLKPRPKSFPVPSAAASEMQARIKSVKLPDMTTASSFGSKMSMIAKHITLLRQEDPTVKVLCFSQWDNVLKMLSESFKRQKIGHVSFEGKGWDPKSEKDLNISKQGLAVSKFIQSDSISCFMLHAKSQSAGLTLVAATHVFLIEPLLHKGLEQQAIGRVFRIGQTKQTYVWRYILQASVEEYLVKECQSEDVSNRQVQLAKKDEGETVGQRQLIEFFDPIIAAADEANKN